jgi:hypothetical protein
LRRSLQKHGMPARPPKSPQVDNLAFTPLIEASKNGQGNGTVVGNGSL